MTALIPLASGSGNFLVSPALGLMIWTLLAFGLTLFVLSRVALPRIGEALEKRANAIKESIDAAEKQRADADRLLGEYRERLKEAREQAEDIVARARKAAEAAEAEATAAGRDKREELVAAARPDREVGTRRGATSRWRPGARWSASARRSPTSRCWRPRRSRGRRSTTTTIGG